MSPPLYMYFMYILRYVTIDSISQEQQKNAKFYLLVKRIFFFVFPYTKYTRQMVQNDIISLYLILFLTVIFLYILFCYHPPSHPFSFAFYTIMHSYSEIFSINFFLFFHPLKFVSIFLFVLFLFAILIFLFIYFSFQPRCQK